MQELSFKANNQFSKSVMMEFLQLLAGQQYRGQLSLVQGAEEVIQLEMSIWTSLCWPGPGSIRKSKHLEQNCSGTFPWLQFRYMEKGRIQVKRLNPEWILLHQVQCQYTLICKIAGLAFPSLRV
jgi:hypothetical protein